MKLAKEGLLTIIVTAVLAVIFTILFPGRLITIAMYILCGFVLWFYRDPDRVFPEGENILTAPADGKIVEIEPAEHPFTGASLKIGIFMTPISVHINRVPCECTVEYIEHVPGRKIPTFAPKASEVNERNYVGLRTSYGPILIVQIAGTMARRIVCRVKCGDTLNAGDRYGMIKFGSKVDIYLPADIKLSVKTGDNVYAGVTILGVVKK